MQHTIRFTPEKMDIDRYDLCILIGNILDNAIEANQFITLSEQRFIDFRMFSTPAALMIHVLNSYQDPKSLHAAGVKANPDFHGLGLTNVRRVAEKYGGHLKTEAGGGQFETIVMIPFGGMGQKAS
ncbi:hypothetical protein D3C73_966740 [compost metagenome]